jgi:hypothetical protein
MVEVFAKPKAVPLAELQKFPPFTTNYANAKDIQAGAV